MIIKDAYKFNSTIKKLTKFKVSNIDENAKKHWKHKPYKCDFGGVKNETLRQ